MLVLLVFGFPRHASNVSAGVHFENNSWEILFAHDAQESVSIIRMIYAMGRFKIKPRIEIVYKTRAYKLQSCFMKYFETLSLTP